MSPTVHRYAVASFLFRQALPGAVGDVPWGPAFLREVFVDHEYSVRNFWRRATLGLVDLEFDFLDVAGSTKYGHMHHAVFTFVDATHHTEDWTFMLKGDKHVNAHFDLQRTK